MMSQRTLFIFWLPLFASWLLMTLEGPIISSAINRLPDEVVMLAAMGIISSLSVTIESPIINLLATSTALAKDRFSFVLIRNFTICWMLLLTFVSILIAFTSLFDIVVIDMMNVPVPISKWVQPGLKIMIFWSAAIAWRRFLQGVLIRYNRTRRVAWGTLIRLISSSLMVFMLLEFSDLSGVIIGSCALMAGVISEAIYASVAVRPILKNELLPVLPSKTEKLLSYRTLFWFHLPLAATSLITLLIQPLVAFSLARSPNPTISLAAWPIVFQFTLVSRAGAFALPEVIIAQDEGRITFKPLRRFSMTLAIVSTLFVAFFIATPLIGIYLFKVQDLTSPVAASAKSGMMIFLPLPALATLISWIRGLLISHGFTRAVNIGMIVNIFVTIMVLTIGVFGELPGISSAAIALCIAATVEMIVLFLEIRNVLDFKFTLVDFRKNPLPS